jgi:23S rRNA (uracil1939-C5)-methyltransferase
LKSLTHLNIDILITLSEGRHGLKVSNLYISQVKRKCGIEVGENYNLPKSEDARQPQCPEEKEKAIIDAF